MSDENPPYNPLVIQAWTGLSLLVSGAIFVMLVFGHPLLEAGRVVWDLLRWLASPII
jgi:hypothetical protein